MARGISYLIALVVFAAALTVMAGSALAAVEYSGALTSCSESPGLVTTGVWGPAKCDLIGWNVSQNANGSWHYAYGLSVPVLSATDFIVQLPTGFGAADILNPTGSFTGFNVGTFSPGLQFPYLPASMYGVDFALTPGSSTLIAFDANIQPDFGNFYAQGTGDASVVNSGFSIPNTHHDPANGSIDNKVLVPDPTATPIPDASTLLLAFAGILTATGIVRKRCVS